jgi:amino acid transporter
MRAEEDAVERRAAEQGAPRLGTFSGVFTPSVLTILGIILFLRLGFVVGNAGLGRALVVILLANLISVLTSLSVAAIATNFKVRAGGDYYLISRTLGPEFGGAIGVVLYLAQSISVAFYAIGFAEGVTALVDGLSPRLVAGALLLPLFGLAWIGADWATRFQYVIMFVLFLAIGAFAVGALQSFDASVLADNWSASGDLTFWAIFALFFPAVTGFTQGVSMSGELRDPAASLPRGTFTAVGLSLLIYLAGAVLFAGALPGAELVASYDSMNRVAVAPVLITAGLAAATFSSALASFLGAPRVLQALASDRLFRVLDPFAHGAGPRANPRRAVLLSFAVAAGTVAVGDLNVVAPVVSMFFLISYGLLNFATYYEARAASPSFRPSFRWYHRRASLLGCVVCGGAMLAIDPVSGAIALAVLLAIHQYLARAGRPDRWADSFQRVRAHLLEMSATIEHDRDWRPVVLAFSDDAARRERLLRFASWIEGGSGLVTAVRLVQGQGALARREVARAHEELLAELRERELEAFVRVVVSSDSEAAFPVLLQAAGLGPIRPNTALFNWFDREETAEDAPAMRAYGAHLRTALRHGCSVLVLAARGAALEPLGASAADDEPRRVDVWWRADASSKLALLLAYLMSRRAPWSNARLRVLTARDPEARDEQTLAALRAELDEVRIEAEAVVVEDASFGALRAASEGTALAFVTFRVGPEGLCEASGAALPSSLAGLPPLALVLAARDIDLEAQPDEGPQAEDARAADAREEGAARARELRARSDELGAAAEIAAAELARARAAGAAEEDLRAAEQASAAAQAAAEDALRRATKAEVKALDLERESPE